MSKRKRGRTDRIQITKKIKRKKERKRGKKNKNPERIQKKKIFLYSDKKIRVKPTDPYSVLNPLTNSLSPSEKS